MDSQEGAVNLSRPAYGGPGGGGGGGGSRVRYRRDGRPSPASMPEWMVERQNKREAQREAERPEDAGAPLPSDPREAALRMVNNGYKGVLIPISSVNKSGQTGQMNYSSAKAALALWPKILVGEFQMRGIQDVRCVAIAPGYVGTPMVKGMNQDALSGLLKGVHIGRLIEPEEIAKSIAYVVENDAMDATCLEITGGLIANGLAK